MWSLDIILSIIKKKKEGSLRKEHVGVFSKMSMIHISHES